MNSYAPDNTNISVIGGGNIGTQFACMCAAKGYTVNIYTSRPQLYDGTLEIVDEMEQVTVGKLNKVTQNLAEAINGCNVIFVTYPAFLLKELAVQILPFIKTDMDICIIPGTGGAEFSFGKCVKKGASLLGIQRVPTVARLERYGKRVRCEGLRKELFLGSIPKEKGEIFADFMSYLWEIPCNVLPNYLSVTLTPSNSILHTTRLRTLFADYVDGKIYERNPLFYGEWNNASSELLFACDDEWQGICRLLDGLDLRNVQSLKMHYESNTVDDLTEKLTSIKSLHNLSSPMKQVTGGWIPDFKSRYFAADFPYGLAIMEEFSNILHCNVRNIKETMEWYRDVTGDVSHLDLYSCGIASVDNIYELYQ